MYSPMYKTDFAKDAALATGDYHACFCLSNKAGPNLVSGKGILMAKEQRNWSL